MADNIFTRAGEALGISKRAIPTQTLGTSRTTFDDSSFGEGAGTFDAPENNANLTGTRRFDEYNRLARDVSIIGASVRLFLNLISNAVWTVNPPEDLNGNEEPVAQEYADIMYRMLFSMTTSWSSIVRKTATFRLYGFSIQEWTAIKMPDGTVGIKDIENRPQKTIYRWKRDSGGTVESVIQRITGRAEVELPRAKIIYAVDDTMTDSPEGEGLFRSLAKTAMRLEQYLSLETVGFTTDLRGIPIARVPLDELQASLIKAGEVGSENRSRAEAIRTALLQPIRSFLQKHERNESTGILLSSATYQGTSVDKSTMPSAQPKWGIDLLSGDSTSFTDIANAINRMCQELARGFGTEHLLLGADGGGSLALARSKIGTFYLTVTSTLLDLLEIYDRDLIAPIAELNGWPEELWPEMGVNEISDRDIEQVLEALAKLAQAGAPLMSDDPAVGEVYDMLGLTRPPDREDDMDLSLNPGRKDPVAADPENEMVGNPEDKVAKARVLRSRRNMQKRGKTWPK